MLIKIGTTFELELTLTSLFLRLGRWERFFNAEGLPSGSH